MTERGETSEITTENRKKKLTRKMRKRLNVKEGEKERKGA